MDAGNLEAFGWTKERERQFLELADPDDLPGRLIGHERTSLRVMTPAGERQVTAGAKFRRGKPEDRPVVGDWLVLQPISGDERLNLRHILPRRTQLSRVSSSRRNPDGQLGGKPAEQVLSSNIDTVFVITGLDDDYSLPRIERYVNAIAEGGATPVALLNKADLIDPGLAEQRATEVSDALPGVAVHLLSVAGGQGLEALEPYLGEGRTIALIGSSGVGKSSLVNILSGEDAALTGETRDGDGKGRHTTTWREMFLLPDARGVLIDNPGLREVGLFTGDAAEAFTDLEELATNCQFRSCSHETEPGCAIRAAVRSGQVTQERVDAWKERSQEAEQVGKWLQESNRRRSRKPRKR